MKGDKFRLKFNDYWRKAQDGKYLENHYFDPRNSDPRNSDPRNSDPVQDRIQLDTDSRTSIEYLKELINMCNQVRHDNGLEVLPK